MKYYVSLFILLVFFGSCTEKKSGPKDVLTGYIEYRFSKEQKKDKILSFFGGKLEKEVLNMTDEQFKKFSSMDGYKRSNFKIIRENCGPEKCFLTYILGHDVYKENEKEYTVDIKKTVELHLIEETWKIVDVVNIKTSIDFLKEISY